MQHLAASGHAALAKHAMLTAGPTAPDRAIRKKGAGQRLGAAVRRPILPAGEPAFYLSKVTSLFGFGHGHGTPLA